MTYGLTKTPKGVEATLSARTRDDFYRDAIAATLEVVYGGEPPLGEYLGTVVPIQAAGSDDLQRIKELVQDCLLAIDVASGTLHPPRWLSFDSGRVTATLPMTVSPSAALPVTLESVRAAGGEDSLSARLQFVVGDHH